MKIILILLVLFLASCIQKPDLSYENKLDPYNKPKQVDYKKVINNTSIVITSVLNRNVKVTFDW